MTPSSKDASYVPSSTVSHDTAATAAEVEHARDLFRDTPSKTYHRAQSVGERLEALLEAGRQRSDFFKTSDRLGTMSLSPQQRASLAISDDNNTPGEAESSADELTMIVRGESRRARPDKNYQSTSAQPEIRSRGNKGGGSKWSIIEQRGPQPAIAAEDDGEMHDERWWKKQLAKYGSIELENKGSVARDHLALERTFLAWLRTSLAFASIGIAITQLFRLNTSISGSATADPYTEVRQIGKPLGATFLGISVVVLSVGFHRYFEAQHWVIRGKFPASRGSITLVTLIAFALIVTSLVVVLVIAPGAYES